MGLCSNNNNCYYGTMMIILALILWSLSSNNKNNLDNTEDGELFFLKTESKIIGEKHCGKYVEEIAICCVKISDFFLLSSDNICSHMDHDNNFCTNHQNTFIHSMFCSYLDQHGVLSSGLSTRCQWNICTEEYEVYSICYNYNFIIDNLRNKFFKYCEIKKLPVNQTDIFVLPIEPGNYSFLGIVNGTEYRIGRDGPEINIDKKYIIQKINLFNGLCVILLIFGMGFFLCGINPLRKLLLNAMIIYPEVSHKRLFDYGSFDNL